MYFSNTVFIKELDYLGLTQDTFFHLRTEFEEDYCRIPGWTSAVRAWKSPDLS